MLCLIFAKTVYFSSYAWLRRKKKKDEKIKILGFGFLESVRKLKKDRESRKFQAILDLGCLFEAGCIYKKAGSICQKAGSICQKAGSICQKAGSICQKAGSICQKAGSICKISFEVLWFRGLHCVKELCVSGRYTYIRQPRT